MIFPSLLKSGDLAIVINPSNAIPPITNRAPGMNIVSGRVAGPSAKSLTDTYTPIHKKRMRRIAIGVVNIIGISTNQITSAIVVEATAIWINLLEK
jgi:hypothetical protein